MPTQDMPVNPVPKPIAVLFYDTKVFRAALVLLYTKVSVAAASYRTGSSVADRLKFFYDHLSLLNASA